jgi:hypothetical protein
VLVEGASEDFPEGKVLELGGPALELSDEQYVTLSRFVRLEPVRAQEEPEPQLVDQPGVQMQSLSTDVPPDPGTVPDIEDMDRDELRAEARRVGAEVPGNASKEELKRAIREKREEA